MLQFGVSFRFHAGRFDFPGQGVELRRSISPAFPSLSFCPVHFSRAVIRSWAWRAISPLFLRSPCTTDYTPAQPDRDLVLTTPVLYLNTTSRHLYPHPVYAKHDPPILFTSQAGL
jgi:hypothetical protein